MLGCTEVLTESMTPCKASNPSFTGKTWSLLSAIFASYRRKTSYDSSTLIHPRYENNQAHSMTDYRRNSYYYIYNIIRDI